MGGLGSGHFQHAGRPGVVGGSAPSGVSQKRKTRSERHKKEREKKKDALQFDHKNIKEYGSDFYPPSLKDLRGFLSSTATLLHIITDIGDYYIELPLDITKEERSNILDMMKDILKENLEKLTKDYPQKVSRFKEARLSTPEPTDEDWQNLAQKTGITYISP